MTTAPTDACCPPVLGPSLEPAAAAELAAILKVIADPARLRLLNIIAATGEACTCDLTEPLGLSQPTVSHHLKLLTEAGLLQREQRGRWAFYRVVASRLRELAEAIDAPVPV